MVKTSVNGLMPYDPTHLRRYRESGPCFNVGPLQVGWFVARCMECGRIETWFQIQRPAYAWQAFYRWELWIGGLYVRWYA